MYFFEKIEEMLTHDNNLGESDVSDGIYTGVIGCEVVWDDR